MKDIKKIQEFFSKPLEENTFKVGQKVTYLGHPAVVTATKEYNGRNFVSVSYDKGTGKTKASDILTTSGDVKPLKEGKQSSQFKSVNEVFIGPFVFNDKMSDSKLKAMYNDALDGYSNYAKGMKYSKSDYKKAYQAIEKILKKRGIKINESVNEVTEDPIDTITMDVPLFIRVLEYAREDAQADMDLHDLAEKAIAGTKQQGLLQMDDYDMLVGELEQISMEENMSLDDQAKAYYLAKVKSGEIDTLPEDPKAAFLAQMMKDQIDHDEETLRRERGLEEADTNKNLKAIQIQLDQLGVKYEMDPKNKIQPFKAIYKPVNKDDDFYDKFDDIVFRYNLKGVVKTSLKETAAYIAETIKLGMMVNEELCEKGKRYIKARQAAGEKSSAYLSGRAVRVCKGQIEWPKKGKKKKTNESLVNEGQKINQNLNNLLNKIKKDFNIDNEQI